MNKVEITESEFKQLFKLGDSCKIPKSTLLSYNKQMKGAYLMYLEIDNIRDKGAYLMYLEIDNIRDKKFKNVDGTPLQANFIECKGYQHFINSLGSKCMFDIGYLDKNRCRVPFWTYTKYKNYEDQVAMKNNAYRTFIVSVLQHINYKYRKYHLTIQYRDYATDSNEGYRCHPNGKIWWDGISFDSLYYKVGGNFETISDYQITHTIIQRDGIFDGRIPGPINRIINSIDNQNVRKNRSTIH